MAAPTPTNRGNPSGKYLGNGHPTFVTIATDPTISFWEKSVTPPGIDGGDSIETTTMHNVTWRPMAPRTLKTLTEFTMTAAYDPYVFNSMVSAINRRDTVTVTFPDYSKMAFFGYIKNFQPGELVEGQFPEATITVVPTNTDTSCQEQAPTITDGTGSVC